MKKIPIQCTYDVDGIPRSALSRWESTFKELLSSPKNNTDQFPVHTSKNHNDGSSESEILLNANIVCQAVCSLKAGKAAGPEQMPSEVLKYNICVKFLTALFSTCLKNHIFPSVWKQAIIVPIPKASMKDPADPLQYRGISLLSIPYKIFAKIINQHLCEWLECNSILAAEQNGFKRGRSTMEHVFNLSTIAETRQKLGLDTFAVLLTSRKHMIPFNIHFYGKS